MNQRHWPEISAQADGPTIAALHLFSQVAGKVATAVVPWRNHGWHLTQHLSARGFRSEPIHMASGAFELAFDLIDHSFIVEDSSGARRDLPLEPMSVAHFYEAAMAMLSEMGHEVAIDRRPNELDPAMPFPQDTAARPYDPDSAHRIWRALLSADRLLRLFRSSFLGKASPVHFFWGSFDLAVTRFSGREAPLHPGGVPGLPDAITREAYSHEVSSAGFWPGSENFPRPAFYSYAYPMPAGFEQARVEPEGASYGRTHSDNSVDHDAPSGSGWMPAVTRIRSKGDTPFPPDASYRADAAANGLTRNT